MRFRNPSHRFATTPMKQIVVNVGSPETRMRSAKRSANAKLVAGPAAATIVSPQCGARVRLYGLYGTGFAQPNRKPPGERIEIMGKIIEPSMSMCGMGLSVSRPA